MGYNRTNSTDNHIYRYILMRELHLSKALLHSSSDVRFHFSVDRLFVKKVNRKSYKNHTQ
jgi:hypothetical protein